MEEVTDIFLAGEIIMNIEYDKINQIFIVTTYQRFFILDLSLVVINSVEWTITNESPYKL
jgi:hypothetical protein